METRVLGSLGGVNYYRRRICHQASSFTVTGIKCSSKFCPPVPCTHLCTILLSRDLQGKEGPCVPEKGHRQSSKKDRVGAQYELGHSSPSVFCVIVLRGE